MENNNIGGYHYEFCIFEGYLEIFLETFRTSLYEGKEYKYRDTNLSILVNIGDKVPKLLLDEADFLHLSKSSESDELFCNGLDYFDMREDDAGNLYYASGMGRYCAFIRIPKAILDEIINIGIEKYKKGELKE